MTPQRVLCGIRPWVATCTEAGGKRGRSRESWPFPCLGVFGPLLSGSCRERLTFSQSDGRVRVLVVFRARPPPPAFSRVPDSPRSFAYGASLMSTRPQTTSRKSFGLPRSPGSSLKPRGCSVITAGMSELDAPHSHFVHGKSPATGGALRGFAQACERSPGTW